MAVSPLHRSKYDHYKLTGVQVTDQIVGSGAFSSDIVLEYVGLKCIGKKLHQALFMQGETTAKVRQLREHCHLLSQIRHPNIAMFIGLFFQQSPILVMEFLPYNLASCIEQYGALPEEVSYSILRDVALGLSYLHYHAPEVIVHGELSASNILLTPSMEAKISYVGEAKFLHLTQPEIRYMAKTNGSITYMPPEIITGSDSAQREECSTDIFSYGILMTHVLTGKLPHQHVLQSNTELNSQQGTCEIIKDRVSQHHPLNELINRCTSKSPELRPPANELVRVLTEKASKHTDSFINRMEMIMVIKRYRRIQPDVKSELALKEKVEHSKQKLLAQEQEIGRLMAENDQIKEQVKREDELLRKIMTDIQQQLPKDEEHNIDENTQESLPKPENDKLHGQKPKILPRTWIPGKRYVSILEFQLSKA